MGRALEMPPAWPDFMVYADEQGRWTARTYTGRPGTPVFQMWLGRWPDEETARDIARGRLNYAFATAHPNGCPGRH